MTDKLEAQPRWWVIGQPELEQALREASDGRDVDEILHELDLESKTENVEPGACFTCGAGPGSADLHTLAWDDRTMTVCFNTACQDHALDVLVEHKSAGGDDAS